MSTLLSNKEYVVDGSWMASSHPKRYGVIPVRWLVRSLLSLFVRSQMKTRQFRSSSVKLSGENVGAERQHCRDLSSRPPWARLQRSICLSLSMAKTEGN